MTREAVLDGLRKGRHGLLYRQLSADTETPVSAWLKLAHRGRGDFLLESVEGGRTRGRFSFIGLDPDLLFRAHGNRAEVNRQWRTERGAFQTSEQPALEALRTLTRSVRLDVPEGLPKALPLLVGYFGYETVGLVEKLAVPATDPVDAPDMLFARPGVILVFDRLQDMLTIVAPVYADGNHPHERMVDEAEARLTAVEAGLSRAIPKAETVSSGAEAAAPVPALPSGRYQEMVRTAIDYIRAGDILQVVLAQRFSMPFPLPPFELYRALRRINPSPFLYYLDLPEFAIAGSSPEVLVRARDGRITIRPIAGTRRRGTTEDEDEANRADLLADPKERAEHLMLLDLGRNDVARVAIPGTVRVTERFTVERYSHVMHMVSNVIGEQRPETDAIDALLAGLPAGTVSGAPKVRAMEIIAELEPEKRGPYAGGIGYFGPDGGMDSCIVLRTALLKDGVMHVTAGAGIVLDSDPDAEQRECEAKAGALMAAAKAAMATAKGQRSS